MAVPSHKANLPARVVRALFNHARASWVVIVLFSLLASSTYVVGSRVVRTKWFYSGNYEENYFSGLQPVDAFWFVAMFAVFLLGVCALLALYRFLFRRIGLRDHAAEPSVVFCVSWIVIFVCWAPYFLVNFPCSLYADSIVIIKQALGINALSSHHPIAYVGLIGVFLRIGKTLFDSYIMGIAFYTAFQMVFMSGVFAYLLSWMARRRISLSVIVVVTTALGVFSIFPLHAVSMWKDGLYASFVLMASLLLFDIVASRGALLDRPSVLVRLALWGLAITLIRSNGIYVMALVWLALIVCYFVRLKPLRIRAGILLAAAVSLGLFALVVGPLSDKLEVKTEPVESYGIPLQQVAAVVVYDGVLTQDQEEFLDTMLPLGNYKDDYIPCSVDGIKWADNFDTEFFDSHQVEFMQTWWDIGLANPGIYAAAYIMESYEYWSFADVARNFTLNGVNDKYDAPDLGIIETNLLEAWFGDKAEGLFPFKFAHLQEGLQSWIVLFAGLLLFVARRDAWRPAAGMGPRRLGKHGRVEGQASALQGEGLPYGTQAPAGPQALVSVQSPFARPWWLVLLPTVANWLTVLISSPFAALPRYILPAVFILPMLVVLPWLVASSQDENAV